MAAAVSGNVIQQGFLWVPAKLAPDFSKFNLLKGLGRLFGLDGLIGFFRSLCKAGAVAVVAWMVLRPRVDKIESLGQLDPGAILPLAEEWLRALAIAVLIVFGLIAMVDWIWQRQRFLQQMRMSRVELKDEAKQSEGDPHIKAKLRQQRQARSKQRMIQAVPRATLVVMNPTHYAVALRYVAGETPAPVCVAKGMDALALKIREIAENHGIAVIEDPPLARALYASIEVDETIPREHYEAVAKIVGVILGAARKRSEGRARGPRPAGL
jgi:flagellar biosynthetic protein FlhB